MLKKSKIIAAVLVFAMLFSTITSAAQAVNEQGAWVALDENNPIELGIGKVIQMPIGTITPDAVFEFEAMPISVDGVDYNNDEEEPNMPQLNTGNMTVSFDSTNAASEPNANNIISVTKTTDNIFAGVTFPHAGIFIYEITETSFTNPELDDETNPHDFVSYSMAIYRIRVYVVNTADFADTYVHAVGIFQVVLDDGTELEGEGTKLSQITFTNNYVRTNGAIDPDDPDPVTESTLSISKTVAGDLANRDRYFNFNVALDIPILVEEIPEYYRAYIVENGVVINPVNNADDSLIDSDAGGYYIRVSTTAPTAFSLKHGQRLVFVNTPVGTSYTVDETATPDYTPSFVITTNNVIADEATGEVGGALGTDIQFVGHLVNRADFTNNRVSAVPTGLNINNLPFVGLIILAVGALILFVAVKSRKRDTAIYR